MWRLHTHSHNGNRIALHSAGQLFIIFVYYLASIPVIPSIYIGCLVVGVLLCRLQQFFVMNQIQFWFIILLPIWIDHEVHLWGTKLTLLSNVRFQISQVIEFNVIELNQIIESRNQVELVVSVVFFYQSGMNSWMNRKKS